MRGIHHLHISVDTGIKLARDPTCSGRISGRAKPMFAAMTDIGKVTFYDGVILDRKDGRASKGFCASGMWMAKGEF